MGYRVIYPANPLLREYIEYFWSLEGRAGSRDEFAMLPPEAAMDVVLSFASPTQWQGYAHRGLELKGSFLSTVRKENFRVYPRGRVDYLAIRFYPSGFFRFFDLALDELKEPALELDRLTGKGWRKITERVGNTRGLDEKIELLESELLKILNHSSKTKPELLQETLSYLHTVPGTVDIKSICRRFGVYPKRLEREFKKHMGMTPKLYSRILRFNRSFSFMEKVYPHFSWQDVVFHMGYYDQAHFIREFSQFFGAAPGEYLRLKERKL